MSRRMIVSALALMMAASQPILAAEGPAVSPDFPALPAPRQFVTHHKMTIGGAPLSYTATAGETYLSNRAGEPIGSLFSFAYVKDGPADPHRPVLFVFNGGPGSSSLWLHLGVVGPKSVRLDHDAIDPSAVPPFPLTENPDSLLDVADIVFIDPIGTGYSRIIGAGKPEDFFGVDEDADSIAQFIDLWLSRNGRWNAPKFVMGESYGSSRAALLPRALMGGPTYLGVMRGITLNGIILLGTTFEGHDGEPSAEAQEAAAAFALPCYAAAAWYHGRIDRAGRTLADYYEEVRRFAATDYRAALRQLAAGTLSEEAKTAMIARVAGYIGVSPSAIPQTLKIGNDAFGHALLADQGVNLGLYDSRYTLPTAHEGHEPVADDPAMGQYVPGFVAAFHDLLDKDLGVHMDRPYGAIVWRGLLDKWNWSRAQVQPGQSFAADLATGMRRNGKLRVLVAGGYYDMVTSAALARDGLEQAGVPADRVTIRNYESGHMLYLGGTAKAFADDVRTLIRSAE
jgi:carboxypeptidase C (cathepsin A)